MHRAILRLSTKKSLFPVQRAAVIVASRAAAIFVPPPPPIFFCLEGKYCPFFGGKILLEKLKKVRLETFFFRHPAGPPETDFFFSPASGLNIKGFRLPAPRASPSQILPARRYKIPALRHSNEAYD